MRRAITLCTEVYIARTLVGIITTIIVIVISSDACAVIVNFDRRQSASKPNRSFARWITVDRRANECF